MLASRMAQKVTTGVGEFEVEVLCLRWYPTRLTRKKGSVALFVERE